MKKQLLKSLLGVSLLSASLANAGEKHFYEDASTFEAFLDSGLEIQEKLTKISFAYGTNLEIVKIQAERTENVEHCYLSEVYVFARAFNTGKLEQLLDTYGVKGSNKYIKIKVDWHDIPYYTLPKAFCE